MFATDCNCLIFKNIVLQSKCPTLTVKVFTILQYYPGNIFQEDSEWSHNVWSYLPEEDSDASFDLLFGTGGMVIHI